MLRPGLLLTLVVLLVAPSTAAADDTYIGWSSLLPGLSMPFSPSSEDDCAAGRTPCVDKLIREMDRRSDPMVESCDHDVVFATAYLRTTEQYRKAVEDPNFFHDNRFENHVDAVFARYYFDAFDAWHTGRRDAVPKAWAIAFRAADARELSGSGNLLLGMNAHVQRDLPFVIAALGAAAPDGTSRKPDHDRVNRILADVYPPLIKELARRFDPSIDRGVPTSYDDLAIFQMLPGWREAAWRNAERLATAPTPEARALVAAEIEAYAASQAELIRAGTAYRLGANSASRDAYCAANA